MQPLQLVKLSPSLQLSNFKSGTPSGSASLTGVEAISNAVPFSRTPKEKERLNTNHHVLSLDFLFCRDYLLKYWIKDFTPQHGETILSQMAKGIFRGFSSRSDCLLSLQFSTALILAVCCKYWFSCDLSTMLACLYEQEQVHCPTSLYGKGTAL